VGAPQERASGLGRYLKPSTARRTSWRAAVAPSGDVTCAASAVAR